MKRSTHWALGLALVISAGLLAAPLDAQVHVRAKQLYTMSPDAAQNPITDGVVVIEDGKITAVGKASSVRIPSGSTELTAEIVTPGLIDVRSTLGLSGAYNSNVGPVRDQDQLETSSPIQPELRAIDAYNAREELIEYARSLGVTTIHTGHGPGALMSGQTLIAKTRGRNVDQALMVPGKMIAVTLGNLSSQFKSPGTRAKGVAMLRGALMGAQEYRESLNNSERSGDEADEAAEAAGEEGAAASGGGPGRDLRKETLVAVLNGEVPLLVGANTAIEMATALRLQREFGFEMVIDGGAESYLMLDELKEAGARVFLHAPRARVQNKSFETAKRLDEKGIPFAVQTGHEAYVPKTRVLLFEAAHYAAFGLGLERALRAITIDSATLLGIDDRVGSLEVGKDGDLVLYNGDPFEYTSQVCGVVIEGELVSDVCR